MRVDGDSTIQVWANPINDVALRHIFFAPVEEISVQGNEFDQIEALLINVNQILEQMLDEQIMIAPIGLEQSITVLPEAIRDFIEFNHLYDEWKKTRSTTSSIVGDITRNAAYFQIVGMGDRALPYIFSRLEDETKSGEPDHWFPALWAITKENPVAREHTGKINQMAAAWLKWGKERGYLIAERVGNKVPQSR
jgi:hypothetical protein